MRPSPQKTIFANIRVWDSGSQYPPRPHKTQDTALGRPSGSTDCAKRMTPDKTSHPRERKERPERVSEPFHVRVKGRDAAGEVFKVMATLENIGEGGLYVLLDRKVVRGAPLSFFVSFSTPLPEAAANAPRLFARGVVVRAETRDSGSCGVAVAFTRHRFLRAVFTNKKAKEPAVN